MSFPKAPTHSGSRSISVLFWFTAMFRIARNYHRSYFCPVSVHCHVQNSPQLPPIIFLSCFGSLPCSEKPTTTTDHITVLFRFTVMFRIAHNYHRSYFCPVSVHCQVQNSPQLPPIIFLSCFGSLPCSEKPTTTTDHISVLFRFTVMFRIAHNYHRSYFCPISVHCHAQKSPQLPLIIFLSCFGSLPCSEKPTTTTHHISALFRFTVTFRIARNYHRSYFCLVSVHCQVQNSPQLPPIIFLSCFGSLPCLE